MATKHLSQMVQQLRTAVLLQDGAGLTDGQLLGCFIEQRDAAAFAALVKRHGPMVMGVCRRLLRNHHDAEDAFQATFLVLVRKAASIVPREMVANWLYGVAHQTALKARATAAKRRGRETQVTKMPEPAVVEQDLWNDLQPLLDKELSCLPDNYRVVIVLCDLEGKTRKEVARQLSLPEGTVGSRLMRARTMLAKRLARHGLTVFGGTLVALVAQNGATAGVPTSVVSSTIKAASLYAASQAAAGVISIKVAALTEGVLKTMLLTKLKLAMGVLLVGAVAVLGSGTLLYRTQAGEPVPTQQEDKVKAEDSPTSGNGGVSNEEKGGDQKEKGLLLPIGPFPVQMLAQMDKAGKITFRRAENIFQWDDNLGGQRFISQHLRSDTIDARIVRAFDTSGREIDRKTLPQLLRTEIPVLVAEDEKAVDPLHLRLIKDGTLILVGSPPPFVRRGPPAVRAP